MWPCCDGGFSATAMRKDARGAPRGFFGAEQLLGFLDRIRDVDKQLKDELCAGTKANGLSGYCTAKAAATHLFLAHEHAMMKLGLEVRNDTLNRLARLLLRRIDDRQHHRGAASKNRACGPPRPAG